MSDDARGPAHYASEIDEARERLVALADGCSDEQWRAAPLDGDPRPVGVIVDHVAHAYEYLAGWMRQILDGQTVTVSSEVVDALNAEHAARAAAVTQAEAVEHLRRSGAAISQLVAGCSAEDLQAGGGRVERLAQIAIRHADDHRAEIEAGLAASSGPAWDGGGMTTSPVARNVAVERIASGVFEAVNGRGGRITFGTGGGADFTPTELLLAAIGGCTAIDVDTLTSRRAEPESFEILVDGAKVRDENGNRLTDIEVTFRITFPAGERGDEARAILPDVVKKSHDKLCTVGRTVEVGTPIATRVE